MTFLEYFKDKVLQKEKNPELFLEKIKASYECFLASKIHWCYFDLETCNPNPRGDFRDGTIIEIGAISDDKTFSELCNPGHIINNSKIHGITTEDVKYKGSTKNIINKFFTWVKDLKENEEEVVILIAHNGANFDRKVLQRHIDKMELVFPKRVYLADSLHIVKTLLEIKKGGLEDAFRKVFGDDYVEKHRALDDSKDLKKLIDHLTEKYNKTLFDLFDNYLYKIA